MNIPKLNDVDETVSRNSEELSEVIKEFICNNPDFTLPPFNDQTKEENRRLHELYCNMYDRSYVRDFALRNFTNLTQMQDFFYKFVKASRMKSSCNREISGYSRIIEMLWDGICGWQW